MRALLLLILFAPAALADTWVVWPDADAGLVERTRSAAAALVTVGDAASAMATLEQTRQLGGECKFGDDQCLRNLMRLSGIDNLLWIQADGDGLRGVALGADAARTASRKDGSLEALLVQLVSPEKYTGTLVVSGAPEGATILIDGEAGPGERSLPPGPHKVRVEAEGYEPFEGEARVEFGASVTLEATLTKIGADIVDPPPPPPPDDPPVLPREGFGPMGISGVALSAIGAVSAGALLSYGLASAPNRVTRELGPLGLRTDNGDSEVNQEAGAYAAIGASVIGLVGLGLVGAELLGD
jgi:hypothetical protein